MTFLYRTGSRRTIALFLLGLTGFNLGLPTVSYALTGGPAQPEFSSFEPVSTNNMVDEFSGDFSYNVPVLNVPGPNGSDYPLSLSYHSGATPEEEASWVGYGWTLNAGAISRNTRGFPDDFRDAPVKYWNKMPRNWTVTTGAGIGIELFSQDRASVNVNASLRYNNYMGFGYNAGIGIPLGKGVVSLGYNISDGQGSFSLSVSPASLLSQNKDFHSEATAKASERYGKHIDKLPSTRLGNTTLLGGNHAPLSYAEAVRPTHASSYYGESYSVSVGLQIIPAWVPIGPTVNFSGSYSFQNNYSSHETMAAGYMYSADANNALNNENLVSDYYVEKETPYNKRDLFLGVPFNNADNFAVSGEGIGGGFRVYHQKVGEFRPNSVSSTTHIFNVSGEAAVGTTFGVGGDIGAGQQVFTESGWAGGSSDIDFSNPRSAVEGAADNARAVDNQQEDVFFRFANDLGGTWQASAGQTDDPISAQLTTSSFGLDYNLNRSELVNERGHSAKGERASYIDFHTIRQGDQFSFSYRSDLRPLRTAMGTAKGAIYEMAVATATGGEYIYGYPVLSRNEKNLQYGMQGEPVSPDSYLVRTSKSDADLPVKVGEERSALYANSFLLTETRTPDYVDRQLDGPSADDFGGYTQFVYQKQWGGTSDWYNWRVPYSALLYQRNSLSDPLDDMGTVNSGQKEVVYLQSVQTKTHTAIFVLNTTDRVDGRDADADTESAGGPRASFTGSPSARHKLRYLSRIDLYANVDVSIDPTTKIATKRTSTVVPIKTVRFEYSNELCKGLTNAYAAGGGPENGKLTLKRMWMEYQGIETKISPYTFGYSYPVLGLGAGTTANYPAKYTSGPDDVSAGFNFSAAAQNPNYASSNLDAWGSYQADGVARSMKLKPWLNQGVPVADFDPAAWQLKVITLPTGGQIHVQYEQDDYSYVQDRPAHAMVSLNRPISDENLQAGHVFRLNMASVGISSATDLEATRKAIQDYYVDGGRKVYFKFLYRLAGDAVGLTPATTNCNTDFVSGYVTITGVRVDNGDVELTLENNLGNRFMLPGDVCQTFVKTQRAGKLNPAGDCSPVTNGAGQADRDPEAIVRQMASWWHTVWSPDSRCAQLNPELSYFRIPLVKAKRGGGLRVKRLMTYDRGMDGLPVLYGSEYLYTMTDAATGRETSSGVATTEPASLREENVLVEYMPRKNQTLVSKAIYGIDRKQAEGPLGESILPAPSVGYSRIVTRNIHSGRSAPGYSITEFATARDYPIQVKSTTLHNRTRFTAVYLLLYTDQVNNSWATQGFSFILNNMHGQKVRQATYPGTYASGPSAVNARPTSEQRITYFEPPRFNQDGTTPLVTPVNTLSEQGGTMTPSFPGREVDLTIAQKAVKDNMTDLNFEIDTDFAILFGFTLPFATVFPSVTKTQAEFYTHATSKVIRYPAIIKQVSTLQDGITHTTENIAFDRFSGEPVITKVNDEFKGGYLTENIMASWVHAEFGPRAGTERLASVNGSVERPANGSGTWLNLGTGCSQLAAVTKGGLLELRLKVTGATSTPPPPVYYMAEAPNYATGKVRIYPVQVPPATTLTQMSDADAVDVRIVRSGRLNQLTTPAGSTTFHNASYAALAPPAAPSPRYQNNTQFVTDINSWLTSIPQNSTQAQTERYELPNTYQHMNISAFAGKLQALLVCGGVNPADATIKRVELIRQVKQSSLNLVIKSFQITCGGQTYTIQN